jgi:hypothetical protein
VGSYSPLFLVDVLAIANTIDVDGAFLVVDLVEHAIVTIAHSMLIPTEFFHPVRSRIGSECLNCGIDALKYLPVIPELS